MTNQVITQTQINRLSEIIGALMSLPTERQALRTAADLAVEGHSILMEVEQAIKEFDLPAAIAYTRTNFS